MAGQEIMRQRNVKVAVMIRGHKIDDKLRHMHAHLDSPDAEYDLFLLLNQTDPTVTADFGKVIGFSQQRCPELGLDYSFPNLFHLCGDIALYFAARELPTYSHFVMIDYDVHFVKSGPAMLNAFVAKLLDHAQIGLDAIGLQYSIVGSAWPPHANAARMFDGVVRFFNFPFIALSRRALAYLHAQRRLERLALKDVSDIVICEAFVPGHLAPAGFQCVDLLDLVPGSYESVRHDSTMRLVPYGLPLGATIDVGPAIEMVHPVYSVADHLRRGVEWSETPDAILAFRKRLHDPSYSFIERTLLDQCEQELEAKLQLLRLRPPAAA